MKNIEKKNEWWEYDGRLFNFRPCLFVFLFLCLGILYAFFVLNNNAPVLWLLLLLPFTAAPYLLLRKKSALIAVWFMALAFVCGGVSYYAKATEYLASDVLSGTRGVHGEVLSVEYLEERTELVLTKIEVDGIEYDGKLVAYLLGRYEGKVKVGDTVFVEGKILTELELYGDGAEYAFADNIRYSLISEGGAQVISNSFRPFALLRERLRDRLYLGMGEDSASLAFALLTGDSSGIESGLLENTRRGGVAHIFAVSGLHIGTLYGVCVLLFNKIKRLKGRKLLRLLSLSSVLLFYAAVCGFSESVIRATVGCIVAEGWKLLGLKRDMTETLCGAGVVVLAVNPVSLFCVGFQLSFLACFGISFLARPIQVWLERVFEGVKERLMGDRKILKIADPSAGKQNKVVGFLSVTVAAQLATAPVLYSSFGYLSVWSLLLNCLLVPCIGWIFPVCFFFSFATCIFPAFLSKILLCLPNLLWTVIGLVFQLQDFTFAIEGGAMGFGCALAYYCALLALSDKFNLSKNKRFVGVAAFAACFVLGCFL